MERELDPYEETVDILDPGTYEKTGIIKTRRQAHLSGDWIGTFNLWLVKRYPKPSIIYQLRAFDSGWSPGLLDVTAGGHYMAGETINDGLREVEEELGKTYPFESLIYLGKKIYMRNDENWKLRYLVDVFLLEDNEPLSSYRPAPDELAGLFLCPIEDLIKLHKGEIDEFHVVGRQYDGSGYQDCNYKVKKDSFPFNVDGYHLKVALLARRYFNDESLLVY